MEKSRCAVLNTDKTLPTFKADTVLEQANNAFTSLYSTSNLPDSQGDGTKILPFIISLSAFSLKF